MFKINISDKGKTFKLETETEFLVGKKIGDKIPGSEIKPELEGYELEITGTTDFAGFPGKQDVEGQALKKVLLKKGWGMHNKQKGLRLRKTVRGSVISKDIIQINLKVIKSGSKKLEEVFPKAEKAEEKPAEEGESKPEEKKPEPAKEEKPEVKPEEKKEESKEEAK